MKRIVNLTWHEIKLRTRSGEIIEIPSSGKIRGSLIEEKILEPTFTIPSMMDDKEYGIDIYNKSFGDSVLPAENDHNIYVVSFIVCQWHSNRKDIAITMSKWVWVWLVMNPLYYGNLDNDGIDEQYSFLNSDHE